MISPDTPPGTDVICIDASPGKFGPVKLKVGAIYTVDKIERGLHRQFVATLTDEKVSVIYMPPWGKVWVGFALTRFRYIDLPKELTDLLDTANLLEKTE